MELHLLMRIKKFDDFYTLDKIVRGKWELFQNGDNNNEIVGDEIFLSWKRSKQYGINPFARTKSPEVFGDLLNEKRNQNRILLDSTMPIIREFFQRYSELVWDIVDPDGILLDTIASDDYIKKSEKINCIPGQNFSENSIGTNATGIALVNKRTFQVFAAEHYVQEFQPYVDSAIPINDPFTGQVMGILHMASDKNVVLAHDTYLLELIIKQIEKSIESRVVKENISIFKNISESLQDPYVLFDDKGMILRCNEAAQYILHAKAGMSLFQVLSISSFESIWDKNLLMGRQELLRLKDGSEWKVEFLPYKREGNIHGGMAIFQKNRNIQQSSKKPQNPTRYEFSDILSQDPAIGKVIHLAKKAAFSEKTVLIMGETGTGKELLAQSIHSYGHIKDKPFIEVNCGAIPKELIASELFGYEGGSFTGAKSNGKKGKFLLADNGTIFLDEIGDLPIDVQVYLLRVLEERTIIPVGGTHPIPIQVRVIAATHKNLEIEVKEGRFREDLFHRLNVISLTVPALRERKGDIPLLTGFFLDKFKEGIKPPKMDQEVMQMLVRYPWPGNIRQLKNMVQRMVFTSNGSHIRIDDLPKELEPELTIPITSTEKNESNFIDLVGTDYLKKEIDKDTLIRALKETNGNISEAARILKTSRVTIYKKIKKYHLA